jgi:hypothetical protein
MSNKIQHQYKDEDGYWIELAPGWKNGDDPLGTCHGIHEDTKREALDKLKWVILCSCIECKQSIGK